LGGGVNHEPMNFPDSLSKRIMIFLGCCALSNDTIAASSTVTLFSVS